MGPDITARATQPDIQDIPNVCPVCPGVVKGKMSGVVRYVRAMSGFVSGLQLLQEEVCS
jgi:hypothetical protein